MVSLDAPQGIVPGLLAGDHGIHPCGTGNGYLDAMAFTRLFGAD
jgi:hypothetical protein